MFIREQFIQDIGELNHEVAWGAIDLPSLEYRRLADWCADLSSKGSPLFPPRYYPPLWDVGA